MDMDLLSFLKERDQKLWYLWARVALWCGVIFLCSALPNYKGKEPNFETLLGIVDFLSRKLAHLLEYAVLMIWTSKAVKKTWTPLERWGFWISLCFVFPFALSDEWHQTFVFGRTGSPMDIFFDIVGAVTGYWLSAVFYEKKETVAEN